jgi:hypothetical protein
LSAELAGATAEKDAVEGLQGSLNAGVFCVCHAATNQGKFVVGEGGKHSISPSLKLCRAETIFHPAEVLYAQDHSSKLSGRVAGCETKKSYSTGKLSSISLSR